MSTPNIEHWIDGAPAPATSGRTSDVHNPATGAVIAQVALACVRDVDTAVASAATAFAAGRGFP